MDAKTDVAVVGGGPCGSFSAFTAAKLGADVSVFEEHKQIGVPSHCAGHISIKGLQELGLRLPKEIIENHIKSAIFYSPSGHEFRVDFASPVNYVLNRVLFDRYLAQLAEEAGARYLLGTRTDSFVLKDGSVKGVSAGGNSLDSKVVVDCEGCSSILLKKSHLRSLDRSMIVNGVEAEVDKANNLEQDVVEVYLGEKYAPGLYAWIIPRPDGSAKVGLATNVGSPQKYLANFVSHNPKARVKLKQSRFDNISFHPITLGGPVSKTYYDGLLLVGDVASHVKPTTGGGVVMGLTCAKIAGEMAYEAVRCGDHSERFLSLYQRRWKKAIGFDMTVMRRMRLMLNNLRDDELDRLIRLCSEVHLDKTLQDVRDMDFQGRGLLPILKNPNALIAAFYFLIASLM